MNGMKGRMTLFINIDRNQWTLYKLNELQKADGYISSERLYQRVTVMSGSLGSRVLSRRGDLRCQNIRPNVSNLTINRWATKLMYHSFSINRLFYRSNYSNQWSIIFWMLIRCPLLKPPLCFLWETRQSKQCGFSIYIFDDSKSKSMVRSEKMALSGLVFARKIARMILIQNI